MNVNIDRQNERPYMTQTEMLFESYSVYQLQYKERDKQRAKTEMKQSTIEERDRKECREESHW